MTRQLLAILALTAACQAAPPPRAPLGPLPESPAGIDRAVVEKEADQMIAIVDELCRCTDGACLDAANADLSEFAEHASMNDPVTDIETNPPDVHALSYAMMLRLVACLLDHHYKPTAFGVMIAREVEQFRDAACGCSDASCAHRVSDAFEKYTAGLKDDNSAATPETLKRISKAADETRVCLAQTLGQEALFELEDIRDGACECDDQACVDGIQAQFEAWAAQYKDLKGTQTATDRAGEIAEEISRCMVEAVQP